MSEDYDRAIVRRDAVKEFAEIADDHSHHPHAVRTIATGLLMHLPELQRRPVWDHVLQTFRQMQAFDCGQTQVENHMDFWTCTRDEAERGVREHLHHEYSLALDVAAGIPVRVPPIRAWRSA